MTLLSTLIAFAIAIGVLVVIHELGHYSVARFFGVKILRFSVGFGRPLLTRRRGPDQTEWVLAALPLGGYVKMLDEREGPVPPQDLERAFNRQSVYRRFAIVVAGPLANLLFAVAAYWVLFVSGVPDLRPQIGAVPPASAAAAAGFARGDEIRQVDGEPVAGWQDLRWALLQAAGRKDVEIQVERPGGGTAVRLLDARGLDLDRAGEGGDLLADLGLSPYRPRLQPVIGQVLAGGAAERAGIRTGDRVVSVDGRAVAEWEDLVTAVRARPNRVLKVEVRRGTERRTLSLTPAPATEGGQTIGRIGAAAAVSAADLQNLYTVVRHDPWPALQRATVKTWDTVTFSLTMFGRMITGEASWKNLSGPITIADYAGQSAQSGWVAYLSFLALVSISLGVLNLLPIPLLDGGHLMYYTVEIIKGRPVSERALAIGQQAGVALLLVLMAFAFYNDINRLFAG